MISEALRLAREQTKLEQAKATKELLIKVIDNPAFDIVAAYILLEILGQNKIIGLGIGHIEEAICMTAVSAAVALKAVASNPDIIRAGSENLQAILKAVPALSLAGL